MKKLLALILGLILIGSIVGGSIALASNDSRDDADSEGASNVADFLANPVYGREVAIHGRVSSLGDFFCPCFELTSGTETLLDGMI